MMRAVEAHSCRRHSPAGQCGAPFFCALDALAINDRSARAGVPPRQLPACHIERVVNVPERAVVIPSVEVVVQGAARRQVLGDRGPLAARAQDVHEAVGYLAQVDRPLVAAALGGRDQWGDQRPFLVGQVTWVAQLATVVATTVLTRPHQRLPPDRNAAKEITTDSQHSRCFRMDTKRNAAPALDIGGYWIEYLGASDHGSQDTAGSARRQICSERMESGSDAGSEHPRSPHNRADLSPRCVRSRY